MLDWGGVVFAYKLSCYAGTVHCKKRGFKDDNAGFPAVTWFVLPGHLGVYRRSLVAGERYW